MSDKLPLKQRFLGLVLDVFHRWSGEVLGKPYTSAGSVPAVPIVAKQNVVALTLLVEPVLAEELTRLAQVMQTSESDVLVRLFKIANMIREYGLYGVPTPDGNQLGIYMQRTQEVHKINLECPAQRNHKSHATPAPDDKKPPSRLN